jgi:hypothetical protein
MTEDEMEKYISSLKPRISIQNLGEDKHLNNQWEVHAFERSFLCPFDAAKYDTADTTESRCSAHLPLISSL